MPSLPAGIALPPGVEPRRYQLDAVAEARHRVAQGLRPVVVAPTGAGKTTVGVLVVAGAVAKGSRVLWIAHRRELVLQALARLQTFGLPRGLLLAGEPEDRGASVQVGSIDTLRRRELPEAQVVVVDEAHRGRARSYERLVEHYVDRGAAILGLTATPARGDGRGLAPVFSALVQTTTAAELRGAGVLVPARTYAPDDPDLGGLTVRAGDFDEGEAAEAMDVLTGSILGHWQRLAAGRRTLAFACTVEHSRSVVAEFQEAGVPAEHLDGTTPTRERDAVLDRLRSGETRVVSNVGVLVEGLDVPAVEAIVLARPTRSVSFYLQAVGRGLRAAPNKHECIVLDHAGNALRLGHPDEERVWSLEGERGGIPTAERRGACCPVCRRVRAPAERICLCGRRWPLTAGASAPAQRVGTLEEMTPGSRRTSRKAMIAEYRRLVTVAVKKGYAIGWARHRFREAFGRWPREFSHVERLASPVGHEG